MGLVDLAHVYDLQTFGSSRSLLKVKTNKSHLILKSKQNDGSQKDKYFFVKREFIPNGDLQLRNWVRKGRILFYFIEDLKLTLPYFICFDVTFKSKEVVPIAEDTDEKVETFLRLNEISSQTILASQKVIPPLL